MSCGVHVHYSAGVSVRRTSSLVESELGPALRQHLWPEPAQLGAMFGVYFSSLYLQQTLCNSGAAHGYWVSNHSQAFRAELHLCIVSPKYCHNVNLENLANIARRNIYVRLELGMTSGVALKHVYQRGDLRNQFVLCGFQSSHERVPGRNYSLRYQQ